MNLFGEGQVGDEQFIVNLQRSISGGSTIYHPPLQDQVVGGARPGCLGTFVHGYHGDNQTTPATFTYNNLLDEPNTTSAITYSAVLRVTYASGTRTFDYNRTTNTEDAYNRERGKSIITAIEVAA